MIILAIANHKGGTGKSTGTCNIGAGLAKEGKRVLLIDLDAQANLSMSFGIRNPSKHVYGAMRGKYPLSAAVVSIGDNLSLAPSVLDLSAAEIELASESGRELILRELLEPLKESYDFVLIDCSPNLGLLTLNAFAAAQRVIIPLQLEYFAAQGLATLESVVSKIQRRLNPSLEVGGVFVSRHSGRKVLSRNVLASIEKHFAGRLLGSKIRECVALAEAPVKGMDVFRYAPKSAGANDYMELTKEIMKRFK